jgi:hypothetical protein
MLAVLKVGNEDVDVVRQTVHSAPVLDKVDDVSFEP